MVLGVDVATTATAALAAVAALAAWATVYTNWLRQRQDRQPNVSAGFLVYSGNSSGIEFVNAGPGLGTGLAFLLSLGPPSGRRVESIVGTGHLQAGGRATFDLPDTMPLGQTVNFVWVCRDIDQRLHIWSYAGRHEHLKKGDYPNLGEAFRRMYPDAVLGPPGVGVSEYPTQPG